MCVSAAAAAAVRVSPSTARRRRPSPSSLCVARGGAFGSRAALPRDFFGLSARGVLWARGGAPFCSRRAVPSEIRMAAVCGEAGELDGAEDPRPAAPPPWLCRAGYARHVSGRVGVKNFRSDEMRMEWKSPAGPTGFPLPGGSMSGRLGLGGGKRVENGRCAHIKRSLIHVASGRAHSGFLRFARAEAFLSRSG